MLHDDIGLNIVICLLRASVTPKSEFRFYEYKFRRDTQPFTLKTKLILLVLQDLVRVLLSLFAVVGVRQRSLEGLGKDQNSP